MADDRLNYLNLPLPEDHDPMAQLIGKSVTYRIAVGVQQGRKAFMLHTTTPLTDPAPGSERVAKCAGLSLHAGVSCEAHQQEKRKPLCRHISRLPVSGSMLFLGQHRMVHSILDSGYTLPIELRLFMIAIGQQLKTNKPLHPLNRFPIAHRS